jgi:hypothetical protein
MLGVDYNCVRFSSVADQKPASEAYFIFQNSGLPLSLHDRNARGDVAAIIRVKRRAILIEIFPFIHKNCGLHAIVHYSGFSHYLKRCSLEIKGNIGAAKLS